MELLVKEGKTNLRKTSRGFFRYEQLAKLTLSYGKLEVTLYTLFR